MHHAATFGTFVSHSTRVKQSRDSATIDGEKWRSRTRLLSTVRAFRRTFFKVVTNLRVRRARDRDVDAVSTAIRDEEDEWRRAR